MDVQGPAGTRLWLGHTERVALGGSRSSGFPLHTVVPKSCTGWSRELKGCRDAKAGFPALSQGVCLPLVIRGMSLCGLLLLINGSWVGGALVSDLTRWEAAVSQVMPSVGCLTWLPRMGSF